MHAVNGTRPPGGRLERERLHQYGTTLLMDALTEPVNQRLAPAIVAEISRRTNEAAASLLARVDMMTTDQFQRGGEREEREALRQFVDVVPNAKVAYWAALKRIEAE